MTWSGELRARQLDKTAEVGWLSGLIACALISGAAIAQGQSAVTRESVVPEPAAAQLPTSEQLPALDACLSRLDPETRRIMIERTQGVSNLFKRSEYGLTI